MELTYLLFPFLLPSSLVRNDDEWWSLERAQQSEFYLLFIIFGLGAFFNVREQCGYITRHETSWLDCAREKIGFEKLETCRSICRDRFQCDFPLSYDHVRRIQLSLFKGFSVLRTGMRMHACWRCLKHVRVYAQKFVRAKCLQVKIKSFFYTLIFHRHLQTVWRLSQRVNHKDFLRGVKLSMLIN